MDKKFRKRIWKIERVTRENSNQQVQNHADCAYFQSLFSRTAQNDFTKNWFKLQDVEAPNISKNKEKQIFRNFLNRVLVQNAIFAKMTNFDRRWRPSYGTEDWTNLNLSSRPQSLRPSALDREKLKNWGRYDPSKFLGFFANYSVKIQNGGYEPWTFSLLLVTTHLYWKFQKKLSSGSEENRETRF